MGPSLVFVCSAFGVTSEKPLPDLSSQILLFSSKRSTVLAHTFRALSRLELIFACTVRRGLFCAQASHCSSTTC